MRRSPPRPEELRVAFCTFRLGGRDGVSVEVAKWQRAFTELGWEVTTVAGSGTADRLVPGLALDATGPPERSDLENALAESDLVVVDNLLSLPLNADASALLAEVLRGRPALLRHHDLVWQHARWQRAGWRVPDDPAWGHVAISETSRAQLVDRGIAAVTIYNTFERFRPGERAATRQDLGIARDELLFLHPTRAIERKNIPEAMSLAAKLQATYWLTGDAEQDYAPVLEQLVVRSSVRVIRRPVDEPADAYAACDAVVFPSTWEGFGNPPLEAALHRRPAAVGRYPIACELMERFGFRWFPTDDPAPLRSWLANPDVETLDHNEELVRTHFSPEYLRTALAVVLQRWSW